MPYICNHLNLFHFLFIVLAPPLSLSPDAGSPIHRPNSPLLSALREAVESVSNMDDFEQIEKIGSGFFAEVYKARKKIKNKIKIN